MLVVYTFRVVCYDRGTSSDNFLGLVLGPMTGPHWQRGAAIRMNFAGCVCPASLLGAATRVQFCADCNLPRVSHG